MSGFLAVGAVTALLKDLLHEEIIGQQVPEKLNDAVAVESLPLDLLENETPGESKLNLFLYRVSPNSGWRNVGLPSRNGQGERTSNPPLALDLHYLLTAHSKENFHAEVLLGCAMQLLHETPVLRRDDIRRIQQAWSLRNDTLLKALATAELAEQAEQVKISPHPMDVEEMSKLWSAFQTHYRPSAAYQATVVLIENQRASRSPLPVLTRGAADGGVISQADSTSPTPTLTAVSPPNKQVSAQLGEDLTLQGNRLDGSSVMDEVSGVAAVPSEVTVHFTDPRSGRTLEATPRAGNTANEMVVRLSEARDPEDSAEDPPPPAKRWSAGFYSVAVLFKRPGKRVRRTTNELPFSLAPRILGRINARRSANDDITFRVRCRPEVRPEQRVALLVGDLDIPVQQRPDQTDTLFFVAGGLPPGDYFVRLRVDGVDSLLVKRPVEPRTPPVFDPNQKVRVP